MVLPLKDCSKSFLQDESCKSFLTYELFLKKFFVSICNYEWDIDIEIYTLILRCCEKLHNANWAR